MGDHIAVEQFVAHDISAAPNVEVDCLMTMPAVSSPPVDSGEIRRPSAGRRPVTASRVLRWLYLIFLGIFFAVPMLAMARFAFQSVPVALLTPDKLLTGWSIEPLLNALTDAQALGAARVSVTLAVLTILINLVLLIPLAIVTEIKAPKLRPVLTAVTLLPWVVPPIALVVGVSATFRASAPWFLASIYSLVPFYALWALPFTYRALDAGLQAINAKTLYEAARSMGASFTTTVFKVLLPNMRASIVAAATLTAALVLGEFAFASLLLKETLPTYLVNFQRSDARGGLALAIFILILTALVIGISVRLMRKRGLNISSTGI
ncbi:MAG: ABC transporter permease subunit [Candidatus Nanopelagicales bacterium]|nr:ABC transporter permease subunit [Candidatus Nanopelagicales bacterium]